MLTKAIRLLIVVSFLLLTFSVGSALAGDTEAVLYSFCSLSDCTDGGGPRAGLVFDAAGNLYGTTNGGGLKGRGTVFQLVPGRNGAWSQTVLYTFCSKFDCEDGELPSAGLVLDSTGNLYGTALGGVHHGGEVFELTPRGDGTWREKILYNFCTSRYCPDGKNPFSGLVFDTAGNLYGTTTVGGAFKKGTVYELSPGANGKWTEKVLYSFNGKDGREPSGSLIFDSAGDIYGTTTLGGFHDDGTVFELTPNMNGRWMEKVLHNFYGKDGRLPYAGLTFDSSGTNLYGTTNVGGAHSGGTVFELTPESDGRWTETVVYSFCSVSLCADGQYPVYAGVIFDAMGNLYGTVGAGGGGTNCGGGCGAVFKLAPGANSQWTETILYSFDGTDGALPQDGLIFDGAGNMYATTFAGGAQNSGTVFEITPLRPVARHLGN